MEKEILELFTNNVKEVLEKYDLDPNRVSKYDYMDIHTLGLKKSQMTIYRDNEFIIIKDENNKFHLKTNNSGINISLDFTKKCISMLLAKERIEDLYKSMYKFLYMKKKENDEKWKCQIKESCK